MPKLGVTCNVTGSSGDLLRKSPIPTSKMTNKCSVSMNQKPKIVNKTTETRQSERLARKRSFQLESTTDNDLSNDRNRSNYVGKIKRFKFSKSNETKSEILPIASEINHDSGKLPDDKVSHLGENRPLEIIGSLGKECNKTGSSNVIQKSTIPTNKMTNTFTVTMNQKPKFIVNEATEKRRSERLARKRSFQLETITNDIYLHKLPDDKVSHLGENRPLEIIGSFGKEYNTTESPSVIQKSPLPTGKMNNEFTVPMHSKPKSVVNETSETKRSEKLTQLKSLTDDYSNDHNRSKDDKNIKPFEYAHTYEMSVNNNTTNCSDSHKATDGIVLSTVVETINVFTQNQSINVTNKIFKNSICWNLNSYMQYESSSIEAVDKPDHFEGVYKLVTPMDTAPSAELSDDLHEQLLLTSKHLETFERDFYLLSKRFGVPSEKFERMTVEDPHSVGGEIYSESTTRSMATLSPMIPDDVKESSSNEDSKLTNEILYSLRKDIAYLINELDHLIEEFPKTLTSWELSIVNDPLT